MSKNEDFDMVQDYNPLDFVDPVDLSQMESLGTALGPGAFSINARPMGAGPQWAQTKKEPPSQQLVKAPSEESIDIFQEVDVHEMSASISSTSQGPPRTEPFQCRPMIVLRWVLVLGIAGLGFGLRFGLNTGGSKETGDPMQGQEVTLPCQIDLESEFNSGQQPDIYQQCECQGSILYFHPEVLSAYEELRDTFIPDVYSYRGFEEERSSCSPKNLALSWLAIENAQTLERATLNDRYAGAVIYYSLNGTQWKQNTGWLSSNSICDWSGISCINDILSGETVRSLNLTDNRLDGSLPSEISFLRSLQDINIAVNTLSGPLPTDLGTLDELVTLNIADNYLTGGLPVAMTSLTKLQLLNASYNSLTQEIPTEIGLLSSLTTLTMTGNSLVGTIPSEVALLQNLRELVLESCGLLGFVPSEIGQMSNLERLQLEINGLSHIPTQIGNLRKLKLLSMSENVDIGLLPSEIGNLSDLEALVLGSCGLHGSIPEEISLLENLRVLDLGNNLLTGTVPANLFNLSQLEVIRLRNNEITGELDATNSAMLNCLDVSSNPEITALSDGQCPAEKANVLVITSCPPEPCSCCACSDQVTGDLCLDAMRLLLWKTFV